MTLDEFEALYDKHMEDEFLEFDKVKNKHSNRSDLHAFILLDKLVPGADDILAAAAHDEVWLGVAVEQLVSVITEEQIVELIRCGVLYDSNNECLSMFV